MTFYIIWHFITFFKKKIIKKKVEAKLISIQVLNQMFLPCLHGDLPGDKGHLGATSPCKRQLPYANRRVPWAMLPSRAGVKRSPSPYQACSDSVFLALLTVENGLHEHRALPMVLPSPCTVVFALTARIFKIKAEVARAGCWFLIVSHYRVQFILVPDHSCLRETLALKWRQ